MTSLPNKRPIHADETQPMRWSQVRSDTADQVLINRVALRIGRLADQRAALLARIEHLERTQRGKR